MPEPGGKPYPGAAITVTFDAARCLHAAECVRGLPAVFDTAQRPWIQPDGAEPEQVAEVVRRCPSGALHYALPGGPAESPDVPTTATPRPGGGLTLRGDLRLQVGDEELADTRAVVCTCGRSERAPLCDGACTRAV